MNGAFGCDKVLLVQAEIDGELDAAEAAALAAHRADCEICRAAAAELAQARALIARELYEPLPQEARRRLMAQLPVLRPRRRALGSLLSSWRSAGAGFGLGAALAASVLLLATAHRQPGVVGELVASHIRALQPGHLEDVPSSDQHTVKPWFDGRIDFAPPVKNLAAQGFPLKGGRLDYVGGRPVAVLIYQRDKHLIDLYVWPAATPTQPPQSDERHGYNLVHWRVGGMALWAVSDLELAQLHKFAEEWQRTP